MKRAKTMSEFIHNLSPIIIPTQEDKDFYVPIFDKKLEKLRIKILLDNTSTQTIFIAGQSGTGKTTALNFLANEELSKKYKVKILYGRDYFDPNDIDIIDILLLFGFTLTDDSSKLKKKYFEKLNTIQKVHDGIHEEASTTVKGTKGEIGTEAEGKAQFKFFNFIELGIKLFGSFKADIDKRREIREVFRLKKFDLLKLLNEIIKDYYMEVEQERKLLFIIDDLDKLRNNKHINDLFIENKYFFLQLECKKIIAIPVHLLSRSDIFPLEVGYINVEPFIFKLYKNPLMDMGDEEEKIILKNKENLKEIVKKRIMDGVVLIEEDAVEEAIKYSGGIVKQFIQILHYAAINVAYLKGNKISLNDIISGCEEIKKLMVRPIIQKEKIQLLDNISKKHVPSETESNSHNFIGALLSNEVIVSENGDPWYEVNPIIEETVNVYAKKQ